jgi:hypothetical protein
MLTEYTVVLTGCNVHPNIKIGLSGYSVAMGTGRIKVRAAFKISL